MSRFEEWKVKQQEIAAQWKAKQQELAEKAAAKKAEQTAKQEQLAAERAAKQPEIVTEKASSSGMKEWFVQGVTNRQGVMQRVLDDQVAKGMRNQCAQCQETFGKHLKDCPKCSTPADPTAPRRTVLIRIYNKGDVAKAYQEDAMFLSQFGWRPQTQSAGGTKGGMNLNIGLGLGRSGSRNVKEITVSYVRD